MADHDDDASAPAEGRTVGDWTAYHDDDGRTYYHNETSGETTWDAPPGFEDDAAEDAAAGKDGEDYEDGAVAAADDADGGAQTPPLDGADDDGFTQSPPRGDDGVTASPPPMGAMAAASDDDGITKSPPGFEADAAATAEAGGDDAAQEEEEEGVVDGQEIGGGWVAYVDPDNGGRAYYYHADTGETQWERPDVDGGAAEGEEGAASTIAGASSPRSPSAEERPSDGAPEEGGGTAAGESTREDAASPDKRAAWPDDDQPMDTEPTTQEEEEPPKNTAAEAEHFLQRPDAVMEPAVLDRIAVLVDALGPQVAGPKAMLSLTNGYGGDTAMCGLMGLWLAELKSEGGASLSGKGGNANNNGEEGNDPLFAEGAASARTVAETVVGRLVRERFTKEYGDAIMALSKKEAGFIDDMIRSDRWRRLLIDLSATNKDSTLFMYCLQSISNLGHHRDIAGRIDQSDYFGVFSSMLGSELSIAAKIAVDGYTKEVADSIDASDGSVMGSLIADLRRTCTSTSYTYLYATEAIDTLISKSKELLSSGHGEGSQRRGLERAMRKWERLGEELEEEMLTPLKTGTTFQRKRRVDAALMMGELFQRKRRRKGDPTKNGGATDDAGDGASPNGDHEDALDEAMMQLLTKSSLGVPLDKEVAENVLRYAYGGSTDRIGDLLVRHPTAVAALFKALFGAKRVRQLETRLKCARLVALAATASERRARSENPEANISQSDEDGLSEAILKGSQLCERLENMVSFAVVDDAEGAADGSVGRQLSAMCIRYPAVARGALLWAKEFASKPDFVETASYPTISPCILSLARLISRRHPLTRPAVLEISLIFMEHSNREISHQKMASIKEQCLRLMLWLCAQGMSLAVLSAVQHKLEKGGSSEMDSALIRYFFAGMLEIARPPFSMSFVRALGGLMTTRPCVDALLSKLFEASKREQIVRLVQEFQAAGGSRKEVWGEDSSLLSTLKGTYCSPTD